VFNEHDKTESFFIHNFSSLEETSSQE